jgi:hypothetical protein
MVTLMMVLATLMMVLATLMMVLAVETRVPVHPDTRQLILLVVKVQEAGKLLRIRFQKTVATWVMKMRTLVRVER